MLGGLLEHGILLQQVVDLDDGPGYTLSMKLSFDLYWSFRSPYSYLAMGRLADLRRDYDIDIQVKIVGPLAIRDAQFFERT